MNTYTDELLEVSKVVRSIGGDGTIHGCIVDIDYYNHIYINPMDGKITPYFAYDMERKYVYKNLYALLEEKKPSLFSRYIEWQKSNADNNMLIVQNTTLGDSAVLVTDKKIYKASRSIKAIQYLLFQDVVRDWNDRILYIDNREDILAEIENLQIDNSIYKLIDV